MIKEINFNRTTDAKGRNGILKQTGIELLETNNDTIMLSPVTKRGVSESCFLEIPKENAAEICEALAGFKTVHAPAFHTAEERGEDGRTPIFYVDIPNKEGEEWINVKAFKTKADAIKFAQEKFGADENGMVSLISQS